MHLHWFRNDLRVDDNPAIKAARASQNFLGVYVIEPLVLSHSPWGFRRCGVFRAHFLLQSLSDLQQALRARGSDLWVFRGNSAQILSELSTHYRCSHVSAQKEHTDEEVRTEQQLIRALRVVGSPEPEFHEGLSLLHPDDLPFKVADTPAVFSVFRKQVERTWAVRPVVDAPAQLDAAPEERLPEALLVQQLDPAAADALDQLGYSAEEQERLSLRPGWTAFPFEGGESAALKRLQDYCHISGPLRRYKETRNGLLGSEYSSKFSPWLANGSLSARRIYAAIREHEAHYGSNQSTYWMLFELLWRDFFRFQARRHGTALFKPQGMQGRRDRVRAEASSASQHQQLTAAQAGLFEQWTKGRGADPFINANMQELWRSGWMSNRGRQNAASWLVHDLGLDWRLGATWFENLLLDYDPASNWGNWQYVAGVGQDPRSLGEGVRRFDPKRQAWVYDRNARYVNQWLNTDAQNAQSLFPQY